MYFIPFHSITYCIIFSCFRFLSSCRVVHIIEFPSIGTIFKTYYASSKLNFQTYWTTAKQQKTPNFGSLNSARERLVQIVYRESLLMFFYEWLVFNIDIQYSMLLYCIYIYECMCFGSRNARMLDTIQIETIVAFLPQKAATIQPVSSFWIERLSTRLSGENVTWFDSRQGSECF